MLIHNYIIDEAKREAAISDVQRARIGAILFTSRGRILSQAHNTVVRGNPNRFTIHAEEYLIAKALKLRALQRFQQSKLYVLVVRWMPSTEKLGMAKPCLRCATLLKTSGLPVFYSNYQGEIVSQ